MKTILYCFVATLVAVSIFRSALSNWSRLKKRTWDEYCPNLRQFDWEEARILFDHEEEERLRDLRDPLQFRRDQRARLDLAMELIGRAYHDSRLSLEWSSTEWRDMFDLHLEYDPELVEAIRLLRKESTSFNRIARAVLLQMWLFSLLHFDQWRFMPVPSVVARRKTFGQDILQAYERVRQAAANMARLAMSECEAELILSKM